MKKTIGYIGAIVLFLFMAACDKIEGPYLHYDETTASTVVFPDIDTVAIYKKVLLEEFTGHKCPNCPSGARLLETLSEEYGDTLIAIAVHAGYFARTSSDMPEDFTTEAGNELNNDFQISNNPSAVINQSLYQNQYEVSLSDWNTAIAQFAAEPAVAAVQIINELTDNKLTINTKVTFLTDYPSPVQLALYVIEDNIVAPQIDGSNTIPDYVHQHILRGALTGTYGTYVLEQGVSATAGTAVAKALSLDCSNKPWVLSNCSVVAILMDAETKVMLQVEKCPFIHE